LADLPVDGVHTGRVYRDADLTRARVRLRKIDDLQNLGSSELTELVALIGSLLLLSWVLLLNVFFSRVLGQQEHEDEGGCQGDEADP
jgi:hypothetical protein